MPALPIGTVTFLFTDIERSTRLLDQDALTMRRAFVRHHELLRGAVESHAGVVFETVGDAVYAVFARPSDAVEAAIDAQSRLELEDWGSIGELRARIAIHTGEVAQRDDYHYVGAPLVRCARLLVLGHGGQTLLSQATVALVREVLPPGGTLRDLGEHTLKDLRAPEHVFQLDAPGLLAQFPPLRSPDARPHNLPTRATRFVGRSPELAELRRLVAEARLLTLVGIGGVGKTRLALRAAADVLSDLADGVWFVDLSAVDEPSAVAQEVAAALGVRADDGVGIERALVDHLREKELLVVLDNCEHLLDACARITGTLLRAAPNVRVLATSRTPLGTEGERVWHVEGLDEAVALFLDRAVSVASDFDPAKADRALVERICERLDRLPLAIELAARRVRSLSLREIDERLEDRFRLLSGPGGPDRRHETLRATVEWSYRLLAESERRLWTRLSVFASTFTLDHAEAVCADEAVPSEEVLDLVAALVDKSLLLVERWPDGSIRYRQPETLRAYARERLDEAAETEVLGRRHAERYLAFAERGRAAVLGPEQVIWVERMAREKDNARTAIAWSLEQGEIATAARLGLAYGRVWTIRWLASEWQWWLDAIEPHLAALPDALRAEALLLAANMHDWRDEYDRAAALTREALELFRAVGDRSGQREALISLGAFSAHQGDDVTAERYYAEGLALREAGEGWRSEASALLNLGYIALRHGDLGTARERFERSAAIRRRVGDSVGVARALLGLAQTLMDLEDLVAAEASAQEGLELFTALGSPNGIFAALTELATIADAAGRTDAAFRSAEQALEQARAGLGPVARARALNVLASIELQAGRTARAEEHSLEAMRALAPIASERGVSWTWSLLGRSAGARGDHERATTLIAAAVRHRERMGLATPAREFEMHGRTLDAARRALGDLRFEEVQARGRALDQDAATTYALAEPAAAAGPVLPR